MHRSMETAQAVSVTADRARLDGFLHVPGNATGLVLFVHGSGSSRFSVRNQAVARVLNEAGLATLLFDLLTPEEETLDAQTGALRFEIGFLAKRLIFATQWCQLNEATRNLSLGYFGASTGGGAALVAAAKEAELVKAVVSRGGRPDLAGDFLSGVKAPTLLIVGGNDTPVIQMNESALEKLHCPKKLEIIPGATHLFEEPGALDEVARLAKEWFLQWVK